jgi:ribosomal protein S3AE
MMLLCLCREKLNSMIRKWQTLIDSHVEAKTSDGYTLRLVGSTLHVIRLEHQPSHASLPLDCELHAEEWSLLVEEV